MVLKIGAHKQNFGKNERTFDFRSANFDIRNFLENTFPSNFCFYNWSLQRFGKK